MRLLAVLLAGLSVVDTQTAAQPDADAALKAFKEAYVKAGKDAGARAAAARELGKTPHLKTYKALAQLLQGDGTGQETNEVRIAAADTIGASFKAIPGAWASPAAVAKLRDRKITDVRVASARAVADVAQKQGLPTLQALADDKPFEMAKEAVLGLGKIPDRSSVPLLIKLLREVERVPEDEIVPGLPFHGLGAGGAVVDDARAEQRARRQILLEPVLGTLGRLTGQGFRTYKEYHAWWSKNSGSFRLQEGR
jgi:HEAT repeat protein